EDLYYRLNVVQVRVPPLRERREDIPQLLQAFIERYGRRYGRTSADVPQEVVQRFLAYDWPGNVRELENLVRRLMVLRDPSYVYSEMRPGKFTPNEEAPPPPSVVVAHPPPPALASPILPPPEPQPVPAPPPIFARPVFHERPRGGSYRFGGYASGAAARPLGEVVAEEFTLAGENGKVDLKALGRKAAEIAEREAIVAMLARTGGSKREAANRLGISYKAILYKIREFGIGRPRTPRKTAVESPLPPERSALVDRDEDPDDECGEEEVSAR